MSEISNSNRSPQDPERQSTPSRLNRRALLRGLGLFAAGGVIGGLLDRRLFRVDQDQRLPGELTGGDYKRLEEAGDIANKRAKELQTRINTTAHTHEPIDISVLDEVLLLERVGPPVWKIDKPILLGDPPKISDLDKGFWFGMQFSDPGGVGRPPSVGIRAVLFDRGHMALSSFFVPAGQDTLAAQHLQIFVMPPTPDMPPGNIMVAYGYNEFEPDHRQRHPNDPSQLVAPGLQMPVD